VSNNSNFVATAIDGVIRKMILPCHQKLVIWSDGGTKHFKNSITLMYLGQVQHSLGVQVEWNFFVSYHGYNCCDLAASHLKTKVKIRTNCRQRELTYQDIVRTTNEIPGHKGEPIVVQTLGLVRKLFPEISNYHHFRIFSTYIEASLDFCSFDSLVPGTTVVLKKRGDSYSSKRLSNIRKWKY
jgi:hypothetical protein